MSARHIRTRLCLAGFACLIAGMAVPKSAAAQDAEAGPEPRQITGRPPPEEMARLSFLVGRWDNHTEFLDAEGEVTSTFHLAENIRDGDRGYLIRPILQGWALEGGSNADFGRSWYRFDQATGEYVLMASDFSGNLDVLRGGFDGDELVLTESESDPHPAGGTIRWRWVFSDIEDDSYPGHRSW